jgi:hypothetical protein
MSSSYRSARATLALIALTGLAANAPAAAHEEPHPRAERRAPEQRPAARREAPARQSHPAYGGHERPAAYNHFVAANTQAQVVRHGNAFNGTVERPIRPGFVSRTFMSGGHVLYTHTYQQHVWHQFGRSFTYEAYVPSVRFPAAYYGWALAVWPRPVAYSWGWRVQPWYPAYGALFTPYPVYASPDLWMTDYILSQNMQAAYQARAVPPPPAATDYVDPAAAPLPPSAPSDYVDPAAAPGASAPPADESAPVPPPVEPAPATAAPAPAAPPPAITPQIKAQLDAQIKVQLADQQAAATATPATLTTQSGPAALRPNHVFFAVVQPLDVPSGPNRHCKLSANDYIKRTGGMSSDDWMIPVVVELSAPSDCPEGLATRIGLNDLNAMENEQEAQVLQAMRAASRSMGPNGPAPAHPAQIADGSAPDPAALGAIRQAQ